MVTVQRAFRAKYAKDPPTDKSIRAWYKQFTETGCLCKTVVKKKSFFSFPVPVKNSIKLSPLVFLL